MANVFANQIKRLPSSAEFGNCCSTVQVAQLVGDVFKDIEIVGKFQTSPDRR